METEAPSLPQVEQFFFFPCPIYRANLPDFLPAATAVLDEHLASFPTADEIYPINQTGSMYDTRIQGLLDYIGNTSWSILNEQGYNMDLFNCTISEFWGQRFFKHGQHIEHIHNMGVQLTGFYFVEVPENSSRPLIFDPRPGKKQINLPERDMSLVSQGSTQVNFDVKAGDILLFNSWLGHGFTPNSSDKEFRFIHFNVGVIPSSPPAPVPADPIYAAEVI
jgi:uncharacterized protein (TIGR02466 family)